MKLKIMIRSMSLLVIIITIFIVILYEPKIESEKLSDSEQTITNILEENIEHEILSTDEIILDGYNSDILTINLDNVIDDLTIGEKNIVKDILNKLSIIDCAKINSILSKGSSQARLEALSYMKKRLIQEDYNRFEGILNQYIDLD